MRQGNEKNIAQNKKGSTKDLNCTCENNADNCTCTFNGSIISCPKENVQQKG